MNVDKVDELVNVLAEMVHTQLYDDSPKVMLSATLAYSSLQFGEATRTLCGSGLMLGASATLRSQFEAFIRAIWALHCASDAQVMKLSAQLNEETQRASQNIPMISEMLCSLEKLPQLENLLVALNEFKNSSLRPLNSFVHAGIHAVHWTKNGASPQILDSIFRLSNGLVVLAFQNIGVLTGQPNIQAKIITAALKFPSILPPRK